MNNYPLDSLVEITLTSLGASRLNAINEQCNIDLLHDTGCELLTNYKEGSTYRNTFEFVFELLQGGCFSGCFTELKFVDDFTTESKVKRKPNVNAFFQVQEGDKVKIRFPKL